MPKVHFFRTLSKLFVPIMTGHLNDNIFVLTPLDGGPGGGAGAHFWPENLLFLRYAYITPIFFGQTDPTQWDHKSPIS